jgi:hypothetical protein
MNRMKSKGQLELPVSFLPDGESNRWLAKYKQARLGKWSIRSGRSLADMSDLAAFYLALDRYDSAIDVAEFVRGHVVFAGDYNIWTFAANALCYGAYACRRTDRLDQEIALFEPVIVNPERVIPDRQQLEPEMLEERARLLTYGTERSVSARLRAIGTLRHQVYYYQAAKFNVPRTEWFPVGEFEQEISSALKLLRLNIEP